MISATSSRVIISLSFSDKDRTTASGFYDVADRLVTFVLYKNKIENHNAHINNHKLYALAMEAY